MAAGAQVSADARLRIVSCCVREFDRFMEASANASLARLVSRRASCMPVGRDHTGVSTDVTFKEGTDGGPAVHVCIGGCHTHLASDGVSR